MNLWLVLYAIAHADRQSASSVDSEFAAETKNVLQLLIIYT